MAENYLKNDPLLDLRKSRSLKIKDEIIPRVLKIVIEWGCKKQTNESFKVYISRRKCSHSIKGKEWIRQYKKKLMESSCEEEEDVSYLCSLISHVCDGIHSLGSQEYDDAIKDDSRIEYWLKKTKDIRNSFAHNDKNSLTDIEIRNILEKLLEVAGKLNNIPSESIASKTLIVKNMLDEVMIGYSLEKHEIQLISGRLIENAKTERKSAWENKWAYIKLPFSSQYIKRNSVFYDINLSIFKEYSDSFEKKQSIFPCTKIFTESKHLLKVVEGVSGSGKTTLTKMIFEKWMQIEDDGSLSFSELDKFDLVLYIKCCNDSSKTIEEHVKENYPDTLTAISEESVGKILKNLKVLVLFDGFDERKNSDDLFHDLIGKFSSYPNLSMIVTTRPVAANEILRELNERELCFDKLTINDITGSAEKISILEKYESSSQTSSTTSVRALFNSLPYDISQVFNQPLYLTLFYSMYKSGLNSVHDWKTEYQVSEAFYLMTQEKLATRVMNNSDLRGVNLERFVKDLLKELGKQCLSLILENGFFLTDARYKSFCDSCSEKVSAKMNYDDVLSGLISQEFNMSGNLMPSYHFYHSSAIEFFASKYITDFLFNSSTNTPNENKIEELFSEYLGQTVSFMEMKR